MPLAYHEHYTVEDYNQWKGDWELIEGAPYAMAPSPTVNHQYVAGRILAIIHESIDKFVSCANCLVLMETDLHLTDDTIVRPDVMVVCEAVDNLVTETPELIIEVVSASSKIRDEQLKFSLYAKNNIQYYILVYPEDKIAKIYENNNKQFVFRNECKTESTTFSLNDCDIAIDFSNAWR